MALPSGNRVLTPAQIQSIVHGILARSGLAGPAQSDEQLQAEAGNEVKTQLGGLIGQVTDALNSRAKAGYASIGGLTQSFAGDLGKIPGQVQQAYSQGEQERAAIGSALRQESQGQGQASSAALAGRLAQINAPGAGGQNADATALAGRISRDVAGRNAIDLEHLSADKQAKTSYAAGLPGIAALQGLRTGRLFGAQINQQLSTQIKQIEDQSPGLIQSIYEHLRDRRDARSQAIANVIAQVTLHLRDNNIAEGTLGLNTAGLAEKAREADLGFTYKTQQAAEKARTASSGKATAAQKAAASAAQAMINSLTKRTTNTVTQNAGKWNQSSSTVKGDYASPSYYKTLHKVIARISPILGPYYSRNEIVRFAQRLVNPYYPHGRSPYAAPAVADPMGGVTGDQPNPGQQPGEPPH